MNGRLRVGLVGYGLAGAQFHSPLLRAAGLDVVRAVTSDPTRRAQVAQDWPDATCLSSVAAMLGDPHRLDLVVLASPTGVHAEQAIACLNAGLPVVVDKPLGTDADQAARVLQTSLDLGVPLTVFQNRRWDAEQLTLRRLLAENALGEVFRFERRWERWRPEPKDRWRENAPAEQGGGLLLDLHSHLVDSAVQLFGPVSHVYAEMAAHTTKAEDDVFLALRHSNGVRSHLGALSVAGAPGPRTRVLGREGSYVVTSFEAEPTAFADLGDLDDEHCGWLVAGEQRTPVPRAAGEAGDFYAAVVSALRSGEPMPVDPRDAVHVLRVLDGARVSAADGAVVAVRP
ncbi:Gfo/Idh/MocA family protein [Angustibacter sp. McL0619]|uniref:Gfo/Idh/MocA family protein n=1 Tax=Angustibacter sp. McL0619 TaxID=3415676 RepID=UPI003CEF11DB